MTQSNSSNNRASEPLVTQNEVATRPSNDGIVHIEDVLVEVSSYLNPSQQEKISLAYRFGADAHTGQKRASGEDYIHHPLAVTKILAEMHLDCDTLCAALLHDVIEDTSIQASQITEVFGADVTQLVEGVSKLEKLDSRSVHQAQAENFGKMLLAMSKDIRVILIKLADRLHNMRTLGAMRIEKRRRIATETLEIYARIAHRLGIQKMKLELEELGFANTQPFRYQTVTRRLQKNREAHRELLDQIHTTITKRLSEEDIQTEVIGKEKSAYKIYQGMKRDRFRLSEVPDLYSFRIMVANVDTCYRVLGVMHNLYQPIPMRFHDFIAAPKANYYQSLHTTLMGPTGVHLNIQIRSHDMDRVAEQGIIAKSAILDDHQGGLKSISSEWLERLLELKNQTENSVEFLESVKLDLFPQEIYVYTPQGKIISLPTGATVIDFAYAVHTDIGNTCVGAKVDRRLMSLKTRLKTGQVVDVMTFSGSLVNPEWLDYAETARARVAIRNALKKKKKEEACSLGERLLDKALAELHVAIDGLDEVFWQQLADLEHCEGREQLLTEIGLGNQPAAILARRIYDGLEYKPVLTDEDESLRVTPFAIKGTEGVALNYARCCHPLPGDDIVGFYSVGRGIVIHTQMCGNTAQYSSHPKKWVNVAWDENFSGEFLTEIKVLGHNSIGVLATVAAAISDMGSNIENISLERDDDGYQAINLTITVTNRKNLADVVRAVRVLPNVQKITRAKV